MSKRIRPRDSKEVIHSLEAGIVPNKGIQHLLVGRNEEVKEIIDTLNFVQEGGSDVRFWMGDFGSGKSFILKTIETLGIQKDFVVSTLDLTPTRRFYASDGKSRNLYREIINNLRVQSTQTNVLETIVEEWIGKVLQEVSTSKKLSMEELMSGEFKGVVENEIMAQAMEFNAAGLSYEFGQSLCKYYIGMVDEDPTLKMMSLRFLKGDFETKTESKKLVDIAKIINDDNWFDAIKNLTMLFKQAGYSGFILNFDEMVNIYKLPQKQTRERNYEKLLNIYNDCKSGMIAGLFINFGVTYKTVFDEYRGMSSYGALKGRLGNLIPETTQLVNTNRTVLPLKPLTPEEIYTLLEKLLEMYNVANDTQIVLSEDVISTYMEEQLNRPGAREFLTPRAVIKDYLEILDLCRQNPEYDVNEIVHMKFGNNPVTKDIENLDDEVEIF